jgi:hypothetical protein
MERLRGRTPLIVSSVQNGTRLEDLREPLTRFSYAFTIDGDPAPDPDHLILRPSFVRDLSAFIQSVLSGGAATSADAHLVRRYD